MTPDKLNLGPQTATIATNQTTTSTSYTNLATTGPTVTVTIGANGMALVFLYSNLNNNTGGSISAMSFTASGANTLSGDDSRSLWYQSPSTNYNGRFGATILLTGLAPGSTTFTCVYKIINASTGAFSERTISVVPL